MGSKVMSFTGKVRVGMGVSVIARIRNIPHLAGCLVGHVYFYSTHLKGGRWYHPPATLYVPALAPCRLLTH